MVRRGAYELLKEDWRQVMLTELDFIHLGFYAATDGHCIDAVEDVQRPGFVRITELVFERS